MRNQFGIAVVCTSCKRTAKYCFANKIFNRNLYSRGTTEWMPNCSPLWFLTTLFITLLVCYWIFKIKNKYIMFFISCACALTSYLLDIFGMIKLPWNIDTALMGVFFVYLGYVSGKLFADKCQKIRGV